MAFNFMGNVKTLTSSVTSLKKELSGVYDVLKQIKGIGPSAFGDVNAVLSKSGQFGNGQGTTVFGKTSVNPAPKFSSQTKMGAAKPGSNAQLSNYEKTSAAIQTKYLDMGMRQAKFGIASGAAGVVTSVVGGVAGMLPDVGDVAKRAGTFYTASAMFGGTNRTQNQLSAMKYMKGGITGPMGTAEAFGTLTNYSFMPGSSNMAMGLGQVGAAAKALNMDNATAAGAVGAMSTGSMGAQLYQYGIRQYDDKGNLRTPGAIAKDLMQRVFYPGQDVTKIGAEQFAKDSMGMNLDYQLSTMGITGSTAEIIKASMGNVAAGKSGELQNFKTSDNPLNPFYKINQSEESLTQDSEKGLLKGAELAAEALVKLNKALEGTPELILQMKGAMQTFNGSKSGSNLTGLVTGAVGALGTLGGAVMNWRAYKAIKTALPNVTKEGAKQGAKQAAKTAATQAARTAATTAATTTATTVAGTSAATAAGVTSAVALPAIALGYGAYSQNKKGQENLAAMERAAAIASGEVTMTGPKDTFMSAYEDTRPWWKKVGSWFDKGLSGIDSDATGVQGGPTSGFFGAASSGVNAFTFSSGSKPMAKGVTAASMSSTSLSKTVGAGFGAKDPAMTTMTGALNYHTGEDTPMPIGTPVYARFAGKVVSQNLSRDLGIAVEIDHGDGYSSIYGHLNLKVVQSGQEVKVGTLLGQSGATGRVRGPHLHFELRKGKVPTNPKYYNPSGSTGDGTKNTASSAAGATPTASNVILGTGSEKEWAAGLLGKLNAPVNDASINALTTWMRHEGGHWKNSANYNPLNTTLDVSNNESMNGVGVKRYKSWEEGYTATVGTLTGNKANERGYTAIVEALKSGQSTEAILAAINSSAWMTGKTGKNPYKFQGGPTTGFNTSVDTANPGTGMQSTSPAVTTTKQVATNNVYVTLQIQQANQQEAEAFAKTIKKYLEKDNNLHKIGSN